jgi:hypothetical protein
MRDDKWQIRTPAVSRSRQIFTKYAKAQKLLQYAASEVNPLKNFLPARWILPLLLLAGKPAASQEVPDTFYQEWVEYRNGEISMVFNQTPVELALYAIRARTGLQIIVPPATGNRLLSLQVNRLPLEPAVRSFITYIGFKNFALMYDDDGRPNRAVVLAAAPEDSNSRLVANQQPTPTNEPTSPQLTAEEREKIEKELGRWSDLTPEEHGRIEDRLKTLPPSKEREQLVAEYGRQLLGIKRQEPSVQ